MEFFYIFNTCIFAHNVHCGYTLELPRRGGSNEYPQCMLLSKIRKLGIPLQTLDFLYKTGDQGCIRFPDGVSDTLIRDCT